MCYWCSVVPYALVRVVLQPATLIVPDNFEGSGGTVTPSSGFTHPGPVMPDGNQALINVFTL